MADTAEYGYCTNKAHCSLAFNHETVLVPLDRRCPECGRPLKVRTMFRRFSKLLVQLLVLAALGLGGYYVKTHYLDRAPVAGRGGAGTTASATRGTADLPTNPARSGVGAQGGANLPSTADDAPAGGAVSKPDFGLENDANAQARRDVLARIDRMPHLTEAQKAKLTSSVDRARGMGCIFIIPFGVGRKALDAKGSDILASGFRSATIQKLLEDPTLVFVVLGYADKQGDAATNEKASIDRAQNVLGLMRDRCAVQNVMYAVGMGGSTLFDGKSPTKNRVVEVWAVYP